MQILTPSGYKDINDVNVGDEVIAYINGVVLHNTLESKERWYDKMTEDFTSNQGDFKFFIINNNFRLYKNQSIWANGNVSHVQYLKVGDIIYDDTDQDILITSIEETTGEEWWRLRVSGDHSYVTDGITLHNASRFWVGAGSTTNWSATSNTNWSASSGGANNATVPGASDDATFNGVGASANGASIVSATITVLSLTFTSGYTNTVTLNAVPTIAGNFTDHTAHSWAGSSGLTISATSTITSGGKTFPNGVSFTGNATTKTLSGNWVISGGLTINASNPILNATTSETLSCAGISMLGALATGTAKIILTGGTWSGAASANVPNNLDFAGNVTVSGTVYYGGGKTMTYVSGTITTTSSTLVINTASATLNTAGIIWNNVSAVVGATTITINSLLSATGTFVSNAVTLTFAGTAGFSVNTLSCTSVLASTITFANTVTYTITASLSASLTRTGSTISFTSDHATNKAIITLNQGASCNVLANFTRIDASAGRTIRTFNGTITTCLNIVAFNDIGTASFAS